jgi:hypothetical protein
MTASLEKFIKAYRTFAVLFLNTFLIFLVLGLALEGGLRLAFAIYDARFRSLNPIQRKYHQLSADLYPGLNADQINDLLSESWNHAVIYEPYTTFKEQPFSGTYFHVDPNGFRWGHGPAPWPPSKDRFNVFLFGGSTTFGYGNRDSETVPSYLESFLSMPGHPKVCVYNFGRSNYYSSQERILFQNLLAAGLAPDLAIFIDGLNDFGHILDIPDWTDEFSRFMDPNPWKGIYIAIVRGVRASALTRAANSLTRGMVAYALHPDPLPPVETAYAAADIQKVIQRYARNKRMIEALAQASQSQALFIWQPVPYYKCPANGNPFTRLGARYQGEGENYKQMKQYVTQHPMGGNFFWAADLQEGMSGPLYVDAVHYSAPMCRALAKHIADFTQRRFQRTR